LRWKKTETLSRCSSHALLRAGVHRKAGALWPNSSTAPEHGGGAVPETSAQVHTYRQVQRYCSLLRFAPCVFFASLHVYSSLSSFLISSSSLPSLLLSHRIYSRVRGWHASARRVCRPNVPHRWLRRKLARAIQRAAEKALSRLLKRVRHKPVQSSRGVALLQSRGRYVHKSACVFAHVLESMVS
jgi:hypothetical protein